jgi:hypothetical protein
MTPAFGLSLILGLLTQAKAPTVDAKADDASARLTYMKNSVMSYKVHPVETDAAPFRLEPEPYFRLNNAVSGVKDGAIFVWLGQDGRPEAAIQVFLVPSGIWIHEFTSLSTAPFIAEVGPTPRWRPSKPGVEFKPVPDAPKPGATPEQRLRQMRAIAERFSADDHFETKAWNSLRLLTKPLARYGKAGTKVEDGALFGFVLAADPEVFLMLEARTGKEGLEWQYALAPMTCYPVKGWLKGKDDGSTKGREVWNLPLRLPADDPAGTFYGTQYAKER